MPMQRPWVSPRPIVTGSVVDVVAPSGPFDGDTLRRGLELLSGWGLRPRIRPDAFVRDRFWAGSDVRRRDELVTALEAPDSDLIWCARGGYGATRIVSDEDVPLVRRSAKTLVGFSDITALHALWWQAGVPSVHGSMVARLVHEPDEVRARLWELVQGRPVAPCFGRPLRAGCVEAALTGGNLAVAAALCGTPLQPDWSGSIVFLEDIGEKPYRLDRLWTQCWHAGLFRGIAGLVLGDFTDCEGPAEQGTWMDVCAEWAERIGVPAVCDVRAGHGPVNQALALGRMARLEADTGLLWVGVDPTDGVPNS